MGNYISRSSSSCACLKGGGCVGAESRRRKLQGCMIMVVHAVEERVIEVGGGGPLKVAEIMLEFPGHFVSQCTAMDSQDMKRATPLPADHEALPGCVYILLPMHRLHTRLSPRDCSAYINLLTTHIVSTHLASLKKSKQKSPASSYYYKHSNGSKVIPLNIMQFSSPPPQLAELPPSPDQDLPCDDDDNIDEVLLEFCTSQPLPPSSGLFSNKGTSSSTLTRSKSWIPKLETISES